MTANIATARETRRGQRIACERGDCARKHERQTDTPTQVGDVFRCDHDRIWWAGGIRYNVVTGLRPVVTWRLVRRWTPRHRRAVRALAAAEAGQ